MKKKTIRHNYYIGVMVNDGTIKLAYEIKDKMMYWDTMDNLIKSNKTPLRFSARVDANDYIRGLLCNGSIAFLIDSVYNFKTDLILTK